MAHMGMTYVFSIYHRWEYIYSCKIASNLSRLRWKGGPDLKTIEP